MKSRSGNAAQHSTEHQFVDRSGSLHKHPGIEFLYVFSGKLELRTAEDKHELAEGDAIYFDSTVLHGYRRIGSKRTTALGSGE